MMNRTRSLAVACALAAAMTAAPAGAHAVLKTSAPAAGSTGPAPKELTLSFNEKIEAAFSGATVSDARGRPLAAGKASVDAANPAVLHVALPLLGPGVYRVEWKAVGHDGHRRKGGFSFTVK